MGKWHARRRVFYMYGGVRVPWDQSRIDRAAERRALHNRPVRSRGQIRESIDRMEAEERQRNVPILEYSIDLAPGYWDVPENITESVQEYANRLEEPF